MTEHGVGGLSLGEVARRMGMRTPSLYVYFDAKNAVYDAVFARGWRSAYDTVAGRHADRDAAVRRAADLQPYLLDVAPTVGRGAGPPRRGGPPRRASRRSRAVPARRRPDVRPVDDREPGARAAHDVATGPGVGAVGRGLRLRCRHPRGCDGDVRPAA